MKTKQIEKIRRLRRASDKGRWSVRTGRVRTYDEIVSDIRPSKVDDKRMMKIALVLMLVSIIAVIIGIFFGGN